MGFWRENSAALLDPRRVTPEGFELVEAAVFGVEEVNDHIDVVDDDPRRAVEARRRERSLASLSAELLDMVRYGLHLPIRGARADDEKVAHRRDAAQVEHDHVLALVVAQQSRRVDGELAGAHLGLVRRGPQL